MSWAKERIDEKLLSVSKEKDLLSRDRSRRSCELVGRAHAAHLMNNHTQYERNHQRNQRVVVENDLSINKKHSDKYCSN